MSIFSNGQLFIMDTAHTTYAFQVLPTGQLEHLHYGRKIHVNAQALSQKHEFPDGNTNCYDMEHTQLSLENMRLEYSSYGKGDIREPFIEAVHEDGTSTVDLVYDSYEINKGKEAFETLPGSYGADDEVETLKVTLKDKNSDIQLELYYYVYADCDVITRRSRLVNGEDERLRLQRLMSLQLDFDDADYQMISFHGAWAREMDRCTQSPKGGLIVNSSVTGASSNRANPFVMLSRPDTTEFAGDVYGFNLIYSGNHYEAAGESAFHQLRFVSGINPAGFTFVLEKGEVFETPEAVMTYSHKGYNEMSHHMHEFVRRHIVRGEWRDRPRPILLNSWEAAYFKINEKSLLSLAKAAAGVGIELFVMDDGWFGHRDNDTSSLGDWTVNTSKLPGGLEAFAGKVTALGMMFGIWVEPEMVNEDSDLYRTHPDWAIRIPGKAHSQGRNQMILDLINPKVQDYVIESMSRIFSTPGISYVKWDMNRFFSDIYSPSLGAEHQGEVFHRYMIGLYHIMDVLTQRFPHILFEGCAAGGNRFDLGILCYFPQIWASDNTDALCRVSIMENYSYGYPLSTASAHVSAAINHQTLRKSPLNTRYNVSAFGVMGYECNLCDMSRAEFEEIKAQVAEYKIWREVFFAGEFYRTRSGNIHIWSVVNHDKSRAVALYFMEKAEPNSAHDRLYVAGLDNDKKYHIYNREIKVDIRDFGDLINTASPVHVKDDSLLQRVISKACKMDGETEDYMVYGDLLMHSGLRLCQGYAATGYDNQTRFTRDLFSRMYFIEEIE